MSRIGRKPVHLPAGVEATVEPGEVSINGPKGMLRQKLPPYVGVDLEDKVIRVTINEGAPSRKSGAMQGLTRALIQNMVVGVTQGYTKSLDLIGVGYRAKFDAEKITLSLGFANPVEYPLPAGISVEIKDTQGQKENQVILTGTDKNLVGRVAAEIRRLRPPEPYKGKGVRYTGEMIRHKAGKAGAR